LSQQPIPGILPRWRDWSGPLRDSLFGLAPDGVFRAASLALRAVRSYRTFSPSPTVAAVCDRRLFAGAHRAPLQFRLSVFCGTVRRKLSFPPACIFALRRSLTAAARLRGIAPLGVRTFLPALLEITKFGKLPGTLSRSLTSHSWQLKERLGDPPPFQNQSNYKVTGDRWQVSRNHSSEPF